jgi:hypothetical protein
MIKISLSSGAIIKGCTFIDCVELYVDSDAKDIVITENNFKKSYVLITKEKNIDEKSEII